MSETISSTIEDKNYELLKILYEKDEKIKILESKLNEKSNFINDLENKFKYIENKLTITENEIINYRELLNTITLKNGINLYYSSTNQNGHFGIPKIIWSNGLGTYPIIDLNGEYGLTQFSYGIYDNKNNLELIK